jgi:hypothetical protein
MMAVEKPKLYPVNEGTAIIKDIQENYTTGYVKMFRSVRKHWVWQDAEKFKWWVDILLEANHKDQKFLLGGKLIECKRGQSVNSLLTWAKRWRTNPSAVRRFMKLLESDAMIVTENVSKTTRLTICNYGSYNDKRNDYETIVKRKRNDDETMMKTNKNVKNDKNVKKLVGADAPKPTSFKIWSEEEFKIGLKPYLETFGRDTLNAFFKYWSEKSATGKMRFQLEKTWETKKRLENWQRIDEEKRK